MTTVSGQSRPRAGSVGGRSMVTLVVIFVAVAVLWNTLLVTPLKIVVVLFHEISHGIAAVLTGGSIDHMEVNAQQGGVCYTRGGSRFFTLTAGYLGSMLFGGAILLGAARTRFDRMISVLIGVFILVMTLLYVRNLFGFAFSAAFGVVMVVAGLKLPEQVNDLLLKTIGLTSCLYAVLDIVDDVLKRPGIGSDADMLAELTGVPSVVWGVIWIAAAVIAAFFFLKHSASPDRAPGDGSA